LNHSETGYQLPVQCIVQVFDDEGNRITSTKFDVVVLSDLTTGSNVSPSGNATFTIVNEEEFKRIANVIDDIENIVGDSDSLSARLVEIDTKIAEEVEKTIPVINQFDDFLPVTVNILAGFYQINSPNYTANPGFKCFVQKCTPGEKYRTSTKIREATTAVVLFFKENNTILSHLEKGTGVDVTYNDYEFIIPEGASSFVVVGKNVTPTLKKLQFNEVKIKEIDAIAKEGRSGILKAYKEGDLIRVASKYDTNNDFHVTFNRKGPNNIYTFNGFSTAPNPNQKVLGNLAVSNAVSLSAINTDWIGPYVVKAVNNVDGDKPTGATWTGGWHGYNGLTNNPLSATGKTISFQWFVDNTILPDSVVYDSNEVVVKVINQIQAYNTEKADGTGRAVLEETVFYITKPNATIEIKVSIRALEPIVIEQYMGLQMSSPTWNEAIFFDNDPNKKWTPCAGLNINSGAKNGGSSCQSFSMKKGEKRITMWLDEFGLGKRGSLEATQRLAYHESYNKAYFNLVRGGVGLTLDTDEIVKWKGGYKFFTE